MANKSPASDRLSEEFRLLGDHPSLGEDDPLGFHDVAARLESLILISRESSPFTVGIEGGWGSGKSSLMMRLRKRLDSHDDIATVWFNAWTAEGHNVLEGLIKSVLKRIDPNILRRVLRSQHFLSVARIVLLIVADLLKIRTVVDEVLRQMQVSVESRNRVRDFVVAAMSKWIEKNPVPGKRKAIVVFVDDLDRCSPENVIQVFEAMKLYLDAPGLIFVVGYDRNIISDAVIESRGYSISNRAIDYVEKIIQFSYSINPPADDSALALVDSYLRSSSIAHLVGESQKRVLFERNGRNPRRIKRFINAFVLTYQLDPTWRDIGAQGLVPVLLIQTYYPEVMQAIWLGRGESFFDSCIEISQVRAAISSSKVSERPRIEQLFGNLNLTQSLLDGAPEDALSALEGAVRPSIWRVSADRGFIDLAETIVKSGKQDVLLEKLELRAASPASFALAQEPSASSEPVISIPDLSTSSTAGRVYISYRRGDVASSLVRKYITALEERLGRGRVIRNDEISAGDDITYSIHARMVQADVVLAVIGPHWQTSDASSDLSLLNDTQDFVRQELEEAFRLKKVVLPVLIGGASFTDLGNLPASLTPLLQRQAFNSTGVRKSDEAIAEAVERLLRPSAARMESLSSLRVG